MMLLLRYTNYKCCRHTASGQKNKPNIINIYKQVHYVSEGINKFRFDTWAKVPVALLQTTKITSSWKFGWRFIRLTWENMRSHPNVKEQRLDYNCHLHYYTYGARLIQLLKSLKQEIIIEQLAKLISRVSVYWGCQSEALLAILTHREKGGAATIRGHAC